MAAKIKPIRSVSQTFVVKPKQNWRGHLLGVCYTFQKLDRVLGFGEKQIDTLLAEAQRDAQHWAQVAR